MSDETRTDPDLPSGLREPEPDGDERRCRCRDARPREHRDLLATVEALSRRLDAQAEVIDSLRTEAPWIRRQVSDLMHEVEWLKSERTPTSRSPGLQRSRGSEPDLHSRG